MAQRVPFLLIQPRKGFSRKLRHIASNILLLMPSTKYDLNELSDAFEPEDYVSAAALSAAIVGAFFGIIVGVITAARTGLSLPLTIGLAVAAAVSTLAFYLFYPGIMVRKIAQQTDNDLVFAMRELALQIESGVTLYEGMSNLAQSDYGYVSRGFAKAVHEINSGVPEKKALQRMALRSESEFLKKVIWQLLTAIDSGAPLAPTLRTIVDGLMVERFRIVKEYSGSLNFLILMYMLVAAAIPSIGMTFMILLSTFSGLGLSQEFYILIAIGSFVGQAALTGFIAVTRPMV